MNKYVLTLRHLKSGNNMRTFILSEHSIASLMSSAIAYELEENSFVSFATPDGTMCIGRELASESVIEIEEMETK